MSKALASSYSCVPPAVVYNAFPWADRQRLAGEMLDRRDASKPSIYWFSQTLGPERGLEDLVLSLPFLNQAVEIHLRGKPSVGFKEGLEEKIPLEWKDKVFFHSPIHNGELLSRVAEHDIGFAGERPDPPNKDLTVSNKLFHYLLGGLAIVASNTAGQKEISEKVNGAIHLYEVRNPRSLANAINALLSSPPRLKAAKAAAIRSAQSDFCWEAQQHVLTELVARNLNSDSDVVTAAEKPADMPTS
jgi:glycosyltransferase involved in cell wall biosynthesis